MSAPKPTPGPWAARGKAVEGPMGVTVAFCGESSVVGPDGSYSIGEDEALANARLIAAWRNQAGQAKERAK